MLIKIKWRRCAKLESVKVVLAHCNLVNKSYQKASKLLFILNNRPLEIEDSVNITLILGRNYKNDIFNRT